MVIKINGVVTKEKLLEVIKMLSENEQRKTLRSHFGKLKRGVDSLGCQEKTRGEWG